MAVALDAAERHRQPVEALAEFVLQFARGLPVQPGGERIGEDRGLGSAGLGGQRFEPGAQILAPDSLEIGRASGRDRGCQYVSVSVVAVSLTKKDEKHKQK